MNNELLLYSVLAIWLPIAGIVIAICLAPTVKDFLQEHWKDHNEN